MDASIRWIRFLDRARAILLASLLALAILAFGGLVWWFPVLAAVLLVLLGVVSVVRAWVAGAFSILRSPVPALAAAAIALALIQMLPLPAGLMARHSVRAVTRWSAADRIDAAANIEAGDSAPLVEGRVILTADRPATLRWVLAAIGCLSLFVVAGHFADRLARLELVWGALVVAFGICTWTGCLQLVGQSPGAFGLFAPGAGLGWAPTRADLATGPIVTRLRPLHPEWARPEKDAGLVVARVDPTFAVGSLVSGPSAYLALAALVLPLVFGLALHRLTPRGSREPLAVRLRPQGGLTPLGLLAVTGLLAAGLAGYLGGLVLGGVVLSGVAVVGLASLRGAGVTRAALCLLLGSTAALVSGDALGRSLGRPSGTPWLAASEGAERTRQVWAEAARLGARFPVFGVGLNGFGAVHAQVKHDDACSSTALSSLLQWWAETGAAGVLLLAIAGGWALWRLPAAWRRLGAADRPLAGALLGSAVGFVVFSALAWTVQLPAVALAAAALGGTMNRWLVGGTDLFVECD